MAKKKQSVPEYGTVTRKGTLGFVGNIWLSAAAQLVAGSWLGLKIASRWLARLPDRWHVRIYPLLLIAVLLVMSVWG